jgi:hypothetical protein
MVMKLLFRALIIVLTIAGFVATYLPLIADTLGWNMRGLAWQWWAVIGFTVFWVSVVIIIVQQYLQIRNLTCKEAELERRKRQLEIEQLEYDKLTRETPPF